MQIVKKTTIFISLFISVGLFLPSFVAAQEEDELQYIDDQFAADEANDKVSSSNSDEIIFEEIQQPKKNEVLKSDYTTPLAAGEILVETSLDLTKPYKERRSQYGLMFSVNNEKFNPVDYYSIAQDRYYDDFSDQEVLAADFDQQVNRILKSVRPIFDYMSEVLTTDLNGELIV